MLILAILLIFFYDVAAAPTNFSLKSVVIDFHPSDNKTVNFYARFSGAPTKDIKDVTGTNSLTLIAPRLGRWLIAIEATTLTTLKPLNTSNLCNNSAGLQCQYSIVTASANLTDGKFGKGSLRANDVVIYAFPNIPYGSLYVSLRDDFSDATKRAKFYASWNRVPILNADNMVVGADISGCNVQYCSKVQAINTKNSDVLPNNGTWYVAVVGQRDVNDYFVWYDNVCPNNCSGFGDCQTGADNYGICSCNQNYEGLKCDPNTMLIEYIILIIIAALVLVSALLGLIAWAYMRRRAQYVEVR